MSKSINKKYAKYSKRPLIATSLAIALGVSVANATWGGGSNSDSYIQEDTRINADASITVPSQNLTGSLVGIYAIPSQNITITLYGGNNLQINTINAYGTPNKNNAYGIYVGRSDLKGSVAFVSDTNSFRSITIEGLTAKNGGDAIVFKKAGSGSVSFSKIGLIYGRGYSQIDGEFGIQNNKSDGVYDFGSGDAKTVFEAFSTDKSLQPDTKGKDAVGIISAYSFSLGGNLEFKGVNAQDGSNQNTGTAGNGGDAYGISYTGNSAASFDFSGGKIVFNSLAGGDGGASGDDAASNGGSGGDAYGIYIDKVMQYNLTINGGDIVFENIQGGSGGNGVGEGKKGEDGKAYAIYNPSNTGTLTLEQSSITVGELTDPRIVPQSFLIYNNISEVIYNFGKTKAVGLVNLSSKNDASGAMGILLADSAKIQGKLELEITAANAATGGDDSGGITYGILSASNKAKSLVFEDAEINFTKLYSGNGQGSGNGGDVYGIYLDEKNPLSISGSGKIIFGDLKGGKKGTQGSLNGIPYIINNASNQTLVIDGVSLVVGSSTASENIGIDVQKNSTFNFGSGEAKTLFSIGLNTSQDTAGNGIGAIGLNINASALTLSGNLEFASIIGGEGGNGQASGKATGMLVAQDAEIVFEDAKIVFDRIVAGGDANGNGLVIGSGITANMYGNAKIVFKSFEAPITTYKRGARTGGENFVLDNQGELNIKNTTSIIASSDGNYSTEGVYGIYNAMESKYKFGTLDFEDLSASGDVAGIVLSSKLTHLSGSLTQNIAAGNTQDSSGVGIAFEGSAKYDLQNGSLALNISGGNAYGIAVRGSAAVFSGGGNATFDVQGDRSVGILLTSDTAEQTATLTLNGVKSPLLQVGNESSTQEAYMLKLKNGEFYADLSLSGSGSYAKTKDGKAFAIYSEGSSTVSGKIVVEDSGLVGSERFAIKNLGALSLAQNSSITLGSTIQNVGEMFGISNSLSDVKFDFGSGNASTTIGKIKSSATSGKNAFGIISSSNLTMSGNLVFSGISAEDGATGAKGGDVYALTATATSTITEQVFDFTNANITFKSISAGLGGNIYALYLDASQNQNLTIKGGKISFEKMQGGLGGNQPVSRATATQGRKGSVYGIYNYSASTLKLENASIAVGEVDMASGYGIYNNIQDANYIFGDGIDGKTLVISNQEQFTGFIVAENAYAGGALEVQGDGRVVGVELRSGKTLQLDSMEFIRVTSGVNKDVYGLKAMDKSTLDLNAAPILKIQANTADTSTTGNAYGVYAMGDFTTLVNSFALELKGEKVYGIYLSEDKQTPHCAEVKASITTNQSGASALQGNEAYAIYNSGTNILSGEIRVGDGTTSAIGNDSSAKAYVLYNNGDLTLDGNILIQDKALASAQEKAHLYNSGKLIFESNASFSAGNAIAQSNLSATGINLDVVMQAGSYVEFRAQKAFDASGGGAVNLTLNGEEQNNTVIIFNGKETQDVVNNLGVLKGQYADISIAGSSQDAVLGEGGRYMDESGVSKEFYARKLNIADMQLNNSHFILAAKQKNDGSKVADNIYIANSSAGEKLDNTLHIVLDAKANNASRVTLAEVDSNIKDNVVFNGLANGDEKLSSVYKGFTTGLVKIKRDDSSGNAIYSSTLEMSEVKINNDFVAPTTVALSTGLSLFNANLNSLSKRMGELKTKSYSQGIWGRVFVGEQSVDFGAKQSLSYTTFQAGYDYKFDIESGKNYLGIAVSYVKGAGGEVASTHKNAPILSAGIISELTSSNTDGVEIALYNSYIDKSGFYSDSIVKFGYFSNELNMFAQSQTYNTENIAAAISEEVGYKVVLGENNEWFITPQGEVAFGYVGESDFTQEMFGEKMFSKQDAVMILRSRVGAAWGYDFSYLAKKSSVKASLYLGTYYAYDYFIGGDTMLEAMGVNGEYVTLSSNAYEGTGRFVMNLGTNIDVQDRTKVYFDFEKSFGGNIQTDYQVSLGVRFGFGEKVSAPKQEEKKATEAALKPKELDESAE